MYLIQLNKKNLDNIIEKVQNQIEILTSAVVDRELTPSIDIAKNPKLQQKHKVVVVPTIIVFDENGDEVKRWQADLSFKMVATKKEIQDYVDELIMSSF